MAMNFLPGSVTVAPYRDDQRRLAVADPLRTYITAMSSLVAYWPLDDSSGVYSRVINPALAEGRQLVVDGDFATDTVWTKGTGWTIASGVLHSANNTGVGTSTTQIILTLGKIYTVTFTVSNFVSGVVRIFVGSGSVGTIRTANGTYTETLVCTGNTTFSINPSGGNFVGDIDNVSVTEVGIPASSAFPTLELVKNGGFDWDVAWTKGAGWTISAGAAHASNPNSTIAQALSMIVGRSYDITFTVSNYVSGTVRPFCGSGAGGTSRSANGTFTETLTCTTNTTLSINGGATFVGDIDNVSVVPHDGLIVWDGDFATDSGEWVKGANWTISSGAAHGANTSVNLSQGCLKQGSMYLITYTILNYSSGTLRPFAGSSGGGATRSANGTYSDALVCNGSVNLFFGGGSFTGDLDNVSAIELPPMIGTLVNGLLINQTSGNSLLDPVTTWDAVNDADNIFSGSLNSALPINEWTLIAFAKVSSAGVWSDGVNRRIVGFSAVDGLNFFVLNKGTTTNNLQFQIDLASTSKTVNDSTRVGATTDWFMVAMTGSKAADQFIAYLNGVPTGSIQTGLGQWVGNLLNSVAVIGASSNAGTAPWSGSIAHVALFNAPLAPDVLMLIAQLGGVA